MSTAPTKPRLMTAAPRWLGLGLLGLASCYSSAQAAREDQTLSAAGFRCPTAPVVRCLNRADRRCTGWDNTWEAECSSEGVVYACRLDGGGRSSCVPTRQVERAAAPPAPAAVAGASAQPSTTSAGPEPEAFVESETDEFTGQAQTRFRTQVLLEQEGRAPRLLHRDQLLVMFHGGDSAMLSHMSFSERWAYLRCHSFHMLIDGERVPLPDSQHDGQTGRRGVTESVAVVIPRGVLMRVVTATNVRYRICNDVFRVPESTLALWRARATELRLFEPGVDAEPNDAGDEADSPEAASDDDAAAE